MLHELRQSATTIAALTEAVRVQFALLAYAAENAVIDQAQAAAFADLVPELSQRGQAVARWAWNADSRRTPLERFAAGASQKEKTEWAGELQGEAMTYLAAPPPRLTRLDKKKAWQVAGGEFLQQFYVVFSSDSGLPANILGRAENFGRQDFLREFTAANRGVYICASCDEARIGTRRRGRLHADIDHFFPKSTYPHLSVHPFNLIPICHSCNSFIKGTANPLGKSKRRKPEDLLLPYRSAGLAGSTFLAVDLDAWRHQGAPFTIKARKANGATKPQLEGYGRIADIPARWNDQVMVDEIGETAFRHLSQFLRAQPELLDNPDALLHRLDEFLGTLQSENLGRDPLTFPIKWLLAHLAKAARDGDPLKDPLLREIRDWTAAPDTVEARQKVGAKLREILEE